MAGLRRFAGIAFILFLISGCHSGSDQAHFDSSSQTTGKVLVVFGDGGAADRYFEVNLSNGRIEEDLRSENHQSALVGSCSGNSLISPNSELIAQCAEDSVEILSNSTKDLETACSVSNLKINGFLWDPQSRFLAILVHSTRVSLNPEFWFLALSGHPKQFETYSLLLCDGTSGRIAGLRNIFQGSSSFAQIVRWSNE